jgi:hypothetical protein
MDKESVILSSTSEPMSEWSVEHEKILIEWADKAMCYRWLHSRANSMFSFLNACYTIPCIIISTLAGTANFAQQRIPEQYQPLFTMVVGGVNILGGIISTIQQFLKITQLNEAHRVSSISWDKFYRNIKIELAKHPSERIAVIHMLKMSKEEFDRLMETSPIIPDKMIHEFKNKFKHDDNFEQISKPEICDVLISTDTFRNPWFNEENREKRALELKQIQQTIEQRKREMEERNRTTVTDFKKTFVNLNHREPTDSEIIANLQEKMDADTIRAMIDTLRHEEIMQQDADVSSNTSQV